MTWKNPSRWAGIALVLAAATLYLATLDNGLRPGELAGGDLITHQYAQALGRPSNAPGYPLYTMGGWLWFHGWRALLGQAANPTAILSAYSTLWALLALWLLYAVIYDLTGNWVISLLAGAFYAVTYFFWYYAVTTEQYTSAVAQTLAIVFLAFRWDAQQERPGLTPPPPRSDRYLLALAFLCGLSLAHMVTVAFIVPPLLWFILSRQPDLLRSRRLVAQALALAALPLLAYAFVYVRGAQHPEWRGAGQWPSTWAWFVDFLSTRQGRGELTWSLRPFLTGEFPSLIWRELGWVVLIGGIGGLFTLGRRRGVFLGSMLLIYLVFSFVDRQGNWFQVIMPAYALLVVSFAAAVQWVWLRIMRVEQRLRTALMVLLVIALAGLVVVRFGQSLPLANQRNRPEDTALAPGRAILADQPASGAAVLGLLDEALSLRYLTDIWRLRPDVQAVSSDQARALLDSGQRPLYVTAAAAPLVWQEVSPAARLSSAGETLIAVTAQPAAGLPAGAIQLDRPIGDGLTLAGYLAPVAKEGAQGDVVHHIRLYWRADHPITHDWSISVRPTAGGQWATGPDGAPLLVDRVHPVHGAYPTTRWQPGEVVADDYALTLPADQPLDGVQIVVYRSTGQGGFENLGAVEVRF